MAEFLRLALRFQACLYFFQACGTFLFLRLAGAGDNCSPPEEVREKESQPYSENSPVLRANLVNKTGLVVSIAPTVLIVRTQLQRVYEREGYFQWRNKTPPTTEVTADNPPAIAITAIVTFAFS